MIAGTYLLSGAMLVVTAYLFDHGVLTATTQTVAWMVIFFFASAGASSAYLTVSEIFPMETRALAIAFFYAVGTALGGISGPILFGNLIATKRPSYVALGYVLGGVLMCVAGLVEIVLGLDVEEQPLEEIATPLSAASDDDPGSIDEGDPIELATRRTGHPAPSDATTRRRNRTGWAPLPRASMYSGNDPSLAVEVESLVNALTDRSPQSAAELAHAASARYWGPGRFRIAMRSGLASGRIRRVRHNQYAAGISPTPTSHARADNKADTRPELISPDR